MKERNKKISNTKISELIKNLQRNNIDQAEELIDLYLEMGKLEKAKYYFAIFRKTIDAKNDKEMLSRMDKIKIKIFSYRAPNDE